MLGAFTAVGGGTDNVVNGVNQPRYTPYHIRHHTEAAGFMTILHGDDRFYNNIFVQNWPVKEVEVKEDILGYAFEPEQRFENPDGTAIQFDSDYLGDHQGIDTTPGPFASAEAVGKQIW